MSLTGKSALTQNSALTNDGFWPDLMLADLLNNYRIPSEMADGVIETGLTMAMIQVNQALQPVKKAMQDLAIASLADYVAGNSQTINSEEILVTQYKHAVFARAKAGLLQQFVTLNRRPQAENAGKEMEQTEQYWLDESKGSIKAFFDLFLPDNTTLGKANTHVVLL